MAFRVATTFSYMEAKLPCSWMTLMVLSRTCMLYKSLLLFHFRGAPTEALWLESCMKICPIH